MSIVYCDYINQDIIDILLDCCKFELQEHFLKCFRNQRKEVKSISIDRIQHIYHIANHCLLAQLLS